VFILCVGEIAIESVVYVCMQTTIHYTVLHYTHFTASHTHTPVFGCEEVLKSRRKVEIGMRYSVRCALQSVGNEVCVCVCV
jgi:hypothetical protein